MTAWNDHRYAVIDVEGNGRHPPDLVELAVVPVVAGEIGEPTAWLFRPDEPITPMARRIHGISNDMVSDAPEFAERAAEVQAHLKGAVVIAHNAGIDLGVLKRKLPDFAPAEVLDTLKLSRRLLPGHASYRLGALVKALDLCNGLPAALKPHRATYDVLVTARLLVHLATQTSSAPLSLEDLRDGPGGADNALF